MFKGPLDVGHTPVGQVPPSPSTVAQYSLFQSGWNVSLTSAALAHPGTLHLPRSYLCEKNDSFIRDKYNHGVACLSGSSQGEGVASDTPRVLCGGNRVILPIPILPCETCETRLIAKMSFICMRTKSHFHINGFAFSLAR